ncbi:Ubiquinone/menaquinone biosynthesis C-methyltransferase UbiE [bacterium HR29]|jgi:SAM-dependent methyltransferase|nr:Ubiquinone/menaquinone biosynthesis C-methyltransferase UbiE [bacterium HR29]
MMRRRRTARAARFRWAFGPTRPLARAVASAAAQALFTPRADRIIDLIGLEPGKRYLDLGCGTGAYARLLAGRAGLDEPPVLADIVPGPGAVDVVVWPEQLPFADASFDCITCLYFIRRFDDDVVRGLALELSRVLAPGGAALVLEIAPVRNPALDRFHRWLTGAGCAEVDLRGWGRLAALFTGCGFGAIDLVNVGPFLVPPIPRVGVLLRHFPAAAPSERAHHRLDDAGAVGDAGNAGLQAGEDIPGDSAG